MAANDEEQLFQPCKRFRIAKSREEEEEVLMKVVPISTQYKNKWAVNMFEEWRKTRGNRDPTLEETCLKIQLHNVENLDGDWEKMSPSSLDFWIGKFVQEVADKKGMLAFSLLSPCNN